MVRLRALRGCDTVDSIVRHRAELPAGDPDRERLRHQAVEAALPMTRSLAQRYAGRGEPLADIQQVAVVGLLKAIDGFDPAYEDFWAYAVPTITGEIKRYFRDKSWAVEVPRRCKDLEQELRRCRDELVQRLHRVPRVRDFAEHLGEDGERIQQALLAKSAYTPLSLFLPQHRDERATIADRVGAPDPGYDLVDLHESIHPALARLPKRERRIIAMRYFGNMTQTQIARAVGISQMHVSRLIARSLAALRASLSEAD
jgi:RNA polymerase sigma-B factor